MRESKLLGIIGGLFPPSTIEYYNDVNAIARERLGETHACNVVIWSIDQQPMVEHGADGRWESLAERLVLAALGLQRAGAVCIIIACNSVHKVYDIVKARVAVPMIHIADATAKTAKIMGISKVGLLGTKYTTDASWFTERLQAQGIVTHVSEEQDRVKLHDVVMNELNDGTVNDESVAAIWTMIAALQAQGAQGVILGCTELRLLVSSRSTPQPYGYKGENGVVLLDTAKLHCAAAAEFVLNESLPPDNEP